MMQISRPTITTAIMILMMAMIMKILVSKEIILYHSALLESTTVQA